MDKTRTLPPLVRGRVTSALEFFVDKIKFFRNILMLTDDFDVVVQVQWWGENLPALIRPEELQIENRTVKNSQSLDSQYHCEKYNIKTTLELFKSYLKTCEVLELSVLEAVENYVIGSAFLKDLINLLKNNNEFIPMPIFDYLGEKIGELIIHVNFLEKAEKTFKLKETEINKISNYCLDKSPRQDCRILSNAECNYLSLGEKTLFYDGSLSNRNYQEEELCKELQPQSDRFDSIKKFTKLESSCTDRMKKLLLSQGDSKALCERGKFCDKSLPKIETSSDCSKVLCFGLNSQQSRSKTDVKNPKIKVPNKFDCKSIKCKSKGKFSCGQNDQSKKLNTKTLTNCSHFTKKPAELKKEKQVNSKLSLCKNGKEPEVITGFQQTDFQTHSSKESSSMKVLDYLFGCDMTKDNEEKALNDFKKMSPSHNLVDSISQLCLFSDENSVTTETRFDTKSSLYLKQTHLNFDFSNPIERDYYEKFFSNSNSCSDFEVAEFLNHPQNSFKLGITEFDKNQPEDKSQVSSPKSQCKFSLAEEEMKKSESKNYLGNNINVSNTTKDCARCKYYKKLSELDTIIESLKQFEQKMIVYEKNSQNSDLFIKKNQIAEDS